MKHIVISMLAHVDAGKTTMTESLLFQAGAIRKRGRVDHGDSFLDFDHQEQDRGITIFSKQVYLRHGECSFTFLDTPGHVDFSAEMERTLSVSDYALLLISGTDGVQAHTQTIWRLLEHYQIPVFVFINKMDISHRSEEELMQELQRTLSPHCISFTNDSARRDEEAALCEETALEEFLEQGSLGDNTITSLIRKRVLFPCFFGAALKMKGISEMLDAIERYTALPSYPEEFGARVFKVSTDEQGNRLTHLKVTGGTLRVKEKLYKDEKADQLRRYCGRSFEALNEVHAGEICAVKGIRSLYPGEGLGFEKQETSPALSALMNYELNIPLECDSSRLWNVIRQLAQEDPQLHAGYDPDQRRITLRLMGEIQREILCRQIEERFHFPVELQPGSVVYKETLLEAVEGVGHYEPLRHYAEVHLLLEPLPPGSGIQIENRCDDDVLEPSYQRLILSHIREKEHVGVLSGSPITDLRITLLSGKAHLKHTEGGDFREATYRAIRNGLRKGKSVLLEPYCQYRLEVPDASLSRAIYDLERIHAAFELKNEHEGMTTLSGRAALSGIQQCVNELHSYTRGYGRFFYTFDQYLPCSDPEAVLQKIDYDCERDVNNPCGSIFCSHGAGYYVPWDEVEQHMALPYSYGIVKREDQKEERTRPVQSNARLAADEDAQLAAIFEKTYRTKKKKVSSREDYEHRQEKKQLRAQPQLPICLLVDGYNVIHDWPQLKALAQENLDAARQRLIQIMSSYQGYRGCVVILVFDAYKVKDQNGSMHQQDNIFVVYTKTAQTADSYIEQATHRLAKEYQVIVATSDGMEQLIAISQGAVRISSRQLALESQRLHEQGMESAAAVQSKGLAQPLAALRQWQDSETDHAEKEEKAHKRKLT